jgi:hypothetical protein
MSLNLQSVEATANLDENGVLHLSHPIRGLEAGEVLVIVVARPRVEAARNGVEAAYDGSEIDEKTWHRGIASNPAFAFLADEAEDVYSWEDGTALPDLRAQTHSP